ncbi:MAG: PQQ-like beta-propeller repeat protein [Planctomycetales bacterium]|nr:PQQ-like beta-propeller repeat protein [bacterium]UNM08297.1 MAG: PQQ-like beta-propeller repeat protein [Planctomycetales bacterium]
MASRIHRKMVLAIAVYAVLWAAGWITLRLAIGRDSGLTQLWSRQLDATWCAVVDASEDGCLVYTQDMLAGQLQMITPDGRVLWSREHTIDSIRSPIQRVDAITYLTTGKGELLALDAQGQELWNCRPDPQRYRELLEPREGSQAVAFLKQGILLYGISAAGEPCWVVNTRQMYDPFGLPSYFEYAGSYSFLCNDFSSVSIYTISGERIPLERPSKPKTPAKTAGGQQIYFSGEILDLRGVVGNGELLYSGGNQLCLVRDGEQIHKKINQLGTSPGFYISPNQVASSAGLILVPTSDAVVRALDYQLEEQWSIPLEAGSVSDAQDLGDAFALVTGRTDNLLTALEHLSALFPMVSAALPFASPAAGQLNPRLQQSQVFRLEVIREGERLAALDIGSGQNFNGFSAMHCSKDRIYLISNDKQLRCLALEAADV